MTDEPENHTLALLQEIRGDIAKVREDMREGFEQVQEQIAELKAEVLRCRVDVAGADLASKQISVRLKTAQAKRQKAAIASDPIAVHAEWNGKVWVATSDAGIATEATTREELRDKVVVMADELTGERFVGALAGDCIILTREGSFFADGPAFKRPALEEARPEA